MQPILFLNNSTNEPTVVTEELKVKKPIITQSLLTIGVNTGATQQDLLAEIPEGECAAYGGQIMNPGCYDLQVTIKYLDNEACSSCAADEYLYSCENITIPKGSVFPLPDGFYTSIKVVTVDSDGQPVANTTEVKVRLYAAYQPSCDGCAKAVGSVGSFDSGQTYVESGAGWEKTMNAFPAAGISAWIWSIDNNFNLSVNGQSIATVNELNFEHDKLQGYLNAGLTADNLMFADGQQLYNGEPWDYPNNSPEPLVKINIDGSGAVTLQGRRSAGVYEPMQFQNGASFRTLTISTGDCAVNALKYGQSALFNPTNSSFRIFSN